MPDLEWGFYVEGHCCTSCGLPHDEAPDFIGWHIDPVVGCCIKRQPATRDEVEQIINAMDVAELACFRYRGTDAHVQLRIRARGHASQIDTERDVNRQRASTGPWRETRPDAEIPTRVDHLPVWDRLIAAMARFLSR